MPSVYALVVAAGKGSRFGGPLPKQYLLRGGATVLRHAVSALAGHPRVEQTLVAIRSEDRGLFDRTTAALAVMATQLLIALVLFVSFVPLTALGALLVRAVVLQDRARLRATGSCSHRDRSV